MVTSGDISAGILGAVFTGGYVYSVYKIFWEKTPIN